MKVILILLSALLSAANAQNMMQVNYYWDQGCSNWANSVDIAWGDNGQCLSYNIPGAGSFNIANCWEAPPDEYRNYWRYETCYCTFFTGEGCATEGYAATVGMDSNYQSISDNNCGSTGQTLWEPVSIKCWWGD